MIRLKAIIMLLPVAVAGCATLSSPAGPTQGVPTAIARAGDRIVASHVGRRFGQEYFALQDSLSSFRAPNEWCLENPGECPDHLTRAHYGLVYTFAIPERPHVDEVLFFSVDVRGNLIEEALVYGLPDCAASPVKCEFDVFEEDALAVAEDAELEPGISDWGISFNWYAGDLQTYVWNVWNYITETSGHGVTVNGNTGVLEMEWGWFVTATPPGAIDEPTAPN
jgi:hypothetical protein